jgi:hypothetical protein
VVFCNRSIGLATEISPYFLLTAGKPLTAAELDAVVERWLGEKHHCRLDFEIGDALAKLERLDLVSSENGGLRCKDLDTAKERLDRTWDDYFDYSPARV